MRSSERPDPEAGDTLIEIIIALALMALTVVTIIGAIGAAVSLSVVHRGQTDVSAALVSASELLTSESYVPCDCPTLPTTPCASGSSSSTAATFNDDLGALSLAQQDVTAPVVVQVTNVGGADCSTLPADPGLEMVWIQATGGGGRVTQTMYLIKADRT